MNRREVSTDMTRIATFLKPVPVAATAIAAVTGAWLAWTPIAGADTQRRRNRPASPTWSPGPARRS